jgi:phage-related protein
MGCLLADGRVPVHAATAANAAEPAVQFLDSLSAAERTRMVRLFEKIAAGHRLSKEDFRQVRGKIYEFKDHRRRMMCFSGKGGWFVTHGFEKKTSDSTPEREIERAERIMQEHLAVIKEQTADSKNEQRPGKRK